MSCIEFKGRKSRNGYGAIRLPSLKGKIQEIAAHRFFWMRENGPIPDGMMVCHTCDNRLCINTDHLFLGTHNDNMADMVKKGRAKRWPGEANPNAKITWEMARQIREWPGSHGSAARHFGISKTVALRIRNGLRWVE